MPRLKAMATEIALWFAAGCVPIYSYLRMSLSCSTLEAIRGPRGLILSLRPSRSHVQCGACSPLQRPVPEIVPEGTLLVGCMAGLALFLVGNFIATYPIGR